MERGRGVAFLEEASQALGILGLVFLGPKFADGKRHA
jgi:hypothetical protein